MNYLELVNDVLVRLRENEVSSVGDNSYSKLIGKYINDAKRQVEDSYNWNILTETLTATTDVAIFSYALTGIGTRFKLIDVIDDTNNYKLRYAPTETMNKWFLEAYDQGTPKYYNFNGVDSNGNTMVDMYPVPDGVYDVRFNIFLPQAPLTTNSDKLLVPSEPVIFLAYAKALAERGEDGGMSSSEAYQLYRSSLSDYISIEAGRYPEEFIWGAE